MGRNDLRREFDERNRALAEHVHRLATAVESLESVRLRIHDSASKVLTECSRERVRGWRRLTIKVKVTGRLRQLYATTTPSKKRRM